MDVERRSRLLLAGVMWIAACGCPPSLQETQPDTADGSTATERRPHVVIITLDTTRADRLGCYGNQNNLTPHMDRLAADGVVFEHAYAVQPITLPAHASIFTGKYPFTHGVRDNNIYRLSHAHQTLASALLDAGYLTTAFVASYILHHRFGLNRGFRFYNDRFVTPKKKGRLPVDRRASEVSVLAVDWLTETIKTAADTPLFLWLHYYDPHADYDPPEPYRSAYGNPYDGEIAYMDDWVGFVIEGLKQRGLYHNTVIVLLGDHGESLGAHGEMTHGLFIYDATTHVPMIAKFPDNAHAGSRVTAHVSQVDVMPTVLDYLQLDGRDDMDGVSLLPLLRNEPIPERDVYSETQVPRAFYWSDISGIRSADRFYIDAPTPELYDISTSGSPYGDNLMDSEPDRAQMLAARLTKMRTPGDAAAPAQPVTIDPQMEAQLAQLGYFVSREIPQDDVAYKKDPKDMVQVFNDQQRASRLLDDGRFAAAVRGFEDLVDADASNPRFWLELAWAHTKMEDVNRAIRAFERAIALDTTNPRAHAMYGRMCQSAHRFSCARRQYKAVLALTPSDVGAVFQLGIIAAREKRYAAAKSYFRTVLSHGDNAAALNNLGFVTLKSGGDEQEGLNLLKRAVAAAADKTPYLASLANAYEDRGRYSQAIETLQRALNAKPDDESVLEALARLYRQTGDTKNRRHALHRLKILRN